MRLSGLEITNRSQIFVTFQEIQSLAENPFPFFKKNRMSRPNFLLWNFWRQKKFLSFLHHSISSHFLQFGIDAIDRSRRIWQKKNSAQQVQISTTSLNFFGTASQCTLKGITDWISQGFSPFFRQFSYFFFHCPPTLWGQTL